MSELNKLSNEQKLSQLMDGEWHGLNRSECVAGLCADAELRGRWMRYHLIRDAIRNEAVQPDQALAARICAAVGDEPEYSNIHSFNTAGRQPASQSVAADSADDLPDASAVSGITDVSAVKKPSWINTGVAGFALAASVALVTVVGLNLFQQQGVSTVPTIASVGIDNQQTVVAGSEAAVQATGSNALFAQGDSANLPVVEFVANTGAYWVSPASSSRAQDEQRLNMMLSRHIENSPTSSREGLLPYSRLVGYQESDQGR